MWNTTDFSAQKGIIVLPVRLKLNHVPRERFNHLVVLLISRHASLVLLGSIRTKFRPQLVKDAPRVALREYAQHSVLVLDKIELFRPATAGVFVNPDTSLWILTLT